MAVSLLPEPVGPVMTMKPLVDSVSVETRLCGRLRLVSAVMPGGVMRITSASSPVPCMNRL